MLADQFITQLVNSAVRQVSEGGIFDRSTYFETVAWGLGPDLCDLEALISRYSHVIEAEGI